MNPIKDTCVYLQRLHSCEGTVRGERCLNIRTAQSNYILKSAWVVFYLRILGVKVEVLELALKVLPFEYIKRSLDWSLENTW